MSNPTSQHTDTDSPDVVRFLDGDFKRWSYPTGYPDCGGWETITPSTYTIQWDMGDYPGFTSYAEARDFQRAHKMTGSSIVPAN